MASERWLCAFSSSSTIPAHDSVSPSRQSSSGVGSFTFPVSRWATTSSQRLMCATSSTIECASGSGCARACASVRSSRSGRMGTPVHDGPPQARFSWSRMRSISRMPRDSATFAPQRKSRSSMSYVVREWLNLAVRWTHVFAAIMWVGQTYFFTWLDHAFHGEKQVWMVHSGGFYIVDKQKRPELLNQTLHWFKWEAAFTWLSGIVLLILVYYTGGIMVDESVRAMSNGMAVAISVGMIVIGWLIYDLLWISPLAKNEMAGTIVSYILLAATIFATTHIFSGRAAYMQIGAMLGTFMAFNVWVRIIPAQQQLIGAVKAGTEPDMRLADRAKQRSKQNTFIVLPVVFIMISNHFPVATYGNQYNWIVLSVLVLIGWGVAAVIRTR